MVFTDISFKTVCTVRACVMSAANDELAAAFEGRHTVDQTEQFNNELISLCVQTISDGTVE